MGEKETECTTECKRRRRLAHDEKAPWALNCGGGTLGGDGKLGEEEKRREACDACVLCVRPMVTGVPSVLMLMRRAAASFDYS